MTSLATLPAWVRIARGVALAAIALAFGGPVLAQFQMPGLVSSSTKAAKEPAKAPDVETPAQGLARAKRQLEETRAAIARNERAPAGVGDAEAGELAEVLLETAPAYEAQIRAYDVLAKAAAARREAEARGTGVSALATPPPYSILLVDELRGNLARKRARIDTLVANDGQLQREAERYFVQSQRADEALRRAREAAETATGDARAAAAWRLKVAEARERLAAARTTLANLAARAVDDEIAAARIDVAVIEADVERARSTTQFTREDLDKATPGSARRPHDIAASRSGWARWPSTYRSERDVASRDFERVRGTADAATDDVALAEARVALAEARLRATSRSSTRHADWGGSPTRCRRPGPTASRRTIVTSGAARRSDRAPARLSATLASWAGYAGSVSPRRA